MRNYSLVPAVNQPSTVPYRLKAEDLPEFAREFNALVDSDFGRNPNLKVLELKEVNGVLTMVGSNPLVLPVVTRLVPSMRVGLPEDLQTTLNDGDTLSIKGNNYVDLGLVLDFTGRRHEMALDFHQQMPAELQGFDRLPAVVVRYGLKNLERGEDRLGLVHTMNTQVRPANILAGTCGRFADEDVSSFEGIPTRLSGGDRILYTAPQKERSLDNLGISWLYLSADLSLDARCIGSISNSNDIGRVVLF